MGQDPLDRVLAELQISNEELDRAIRGTDDVEIQESKAEPAREDYFAFAVAMLEPWRKRP
jgi:hypothetical protein